MADGSCSSLTGIRIEMKILQRLGDNWNKRLLLLVATLLASYGISAVYVAGPFLQAAVVLVIAGDSSLMYEGFTNRGIGGRPDISDLLAHALFSQLFAAGLVTAVAMALTNTKRAFLWSGTIVGAACWTFFDLLALPYSNAELIESLLSNIAGGFLLSIFSYVVIANFASVVSIVGGNKILERVIWVLWPMACYLVLAIALYIIVGFLINIPTTQVSFKLEPPMRGYYTGKTSKGCRFAGSGIADEKRKKADTPACKPSSEKSTRSSGDRFGIMDRLSEKQANNLEWVGKANNFSFKWVKGIQEPVIAELRIVQGCRFPTDGTVAMNVAPFLRGPVSKLEILGNAGMSEFRIVQSDRPGDVTIEDMDGLDISQFWLGPSDKDPEKLEVQRFLGNGKITVRESLRQISYEVGLFVFNTDDRELGADRRTFSLKLDGLKGVKSIVVSNTRSTVTPDEVLTCKAVDVEADSNGFAADVSAPYASLLVTILPPKQISYASLAGNNDLVVAGLNGWASTSGWAKVSWTELVQTGQLGQLSFFGIFKDAQVGERQINASGTGTLAISGNMQVRTDGSALLLSGNASHALLNEHRITSTRWEKLEVEMRVAILLGVPTAFYFLLRLALSTLRRPIRKVWKAP